MPFLGNSPYSRRVGTNNAWLTGVNTNRWRHHIFRNTADPASKNVLTYVYCSGGRSIYTCWFGSVTLLWCPPNVLHTQACQFSAPLSTTMWTEPSRRHTLTWLVQLHIVFNGWRGGYIYFWVQSVCINQSM